MKKTIIISIIVFILTFAAGACGTYFYMNNKEDEETVTSKKEETKTEKEDKESKEETKATKEKLSKEEIAEKMGPIIDGPVAPYKDFLEEQCDFKAQQFLWKTDLDIEFDNSTPYKEYRQKSITAFEKAYKNTTDEEAEKIKKEYFDDIYTYYKDSDPVGLTLKSIGTLQEDAIYPMFDNLEVTYADPTGNEETYVLIFYKDSLIGFDTKEQIDSERASVKAYFSDYE